ncbi:MAG TPA: hypothetical protein VK982_10865 [Bacteroidales bacterium]|nr:hypothetical protein [Bacteroidales bacterium]
MYLVKFENINDNLVKGYRCFIAESVDSAIFLAQEWQETCNEAVNNDKNYTFNFDFENAIIYTVSKNGYVDL